MTIIYRADDGTEFYTARECQEYEHSKTTGGFWLFACAVIAVIIFIV